MKKLIILIILLSPAFASAHGLTNDEEFIIRMTENGFEPKELTLTEGDEVLFINNDDVDRWPASNFHPTHTLYPEFDPMRGIPPGESWTFIFESPGTWRMHDHLIPHMTGTIVVLEDPNAPDDRDNEATEEDASTGFFAGIKNFFINIWKKIIGKSNDTVSAAEGNVSQKLLGEFKGLDERKKYAWLEDMAEKESPETAWRYIKAAYETPEGIVGNPHDMAHLVGQLLFNEYGFDGLSTCDPSFAFGCYHGLMEVALDKDNSEDYEQKLTEAQAGCSEVGPATSPTYWSCIHGMGHGIATFREHDMELSIGDCDFLPQSLQTYCQDGIFMEFSISAPPSFYTKNNPLYPCDTVAENAKVACARSQSKVMMNRFGLEPRDVARICLESGNSTIIYHCIDSLGYFIGQTAQGDENKIIAGCNKIENKPSAAQCLAAAAGELVFQNYVDWKGSVAVICQSLTGEHRNACEKRVEQVKKSYERK